MEIIGEGTYGQVYKAKDSLTGKLWEKKIKNLRWIKTQIILIKITDVWNEMVVIMKTKKVS